MINEAILLGLTDAIVPLNGYLSKFSGLAYAPWRKPGETKISARDFGLLEFFADLLSASENDEDTQLAKRWAQLEHDPLQELKRLIPDAETWRRDRLDNPQEPNFGVLESENFEIHSKVPGHGASRRTFYEECFPILEAIVAQEAPDSPDQWLRLAIKLLNDVHKDWQNKRFRSSEFIQQLVKDVLYCLMGMKSRNRDPSGLTRETYASEATQYALLKELGEGRRVGNARSVEDVDRAVATLKIALDK
jgi:hypothetical protein